MQQNVVGLFPGKKGHDLALYQDGTLRAWGTNASVLGTQGVRVRVPAL